MKYVYIVKDCDGNIAGVFGTENKARKYANDQYRLFEIECSVSAWEVE